ncbi:MAG TPA: type II toxin-antitoxin system VapC family toxin [Thermoanaerobaculia bacterium]|nr:type II toxin-antitoxin system VapC family toxin [Thermoanaerobaculia bacterium]
MVVDTSALLAIFFAEPFGHWAAERLAERAGELCMSTVNLTETLIRLRDRQPHLFERIEAELLSSGIRFVPPDVQQARVAAEARIRYPLNLGDCFAYALATVEDLPILAIDRDFRAIDRPVVHPDTWQKTS